MAAEDQTMMQDWATSMVTFSSAFSFAYSVHLLVGVVNGKVNTTSTFRLQKVCFILRTSSSKMKRQFPQSSKKRLSPTQSILHQLWKRAKVSKALKWTKALVSVVVSWKLIFRVLICRRHDFCVLQCAEVNDVKQTTWDLNSEFSCLCILRQARWAWDTSLLGQKLHCFQNLFGVSASFWTLAASRCGAGNHSRKLWQDLGLAALVPWAFFRVFVELRKGLENCQSFDGKLIIWWIEPCHVFLWDSSFVQNR